MERRKGREGMEERKRKGGNVTKRGKKEEGRETRTRKGEKDYDGGKG